jgi:hypothetical protein
MHDVFASRCNEGDVRCAEEWGKVLAGPRAQLGRCSKEMNGFGPGSNDRRRRLCMALLPVASPRWKSGSQQTAAEDLTLFC